MKAWDIYTGDLFGPHPCVLVSCQARIDLKPQVVVLKCTFMRPEQQRLPKDNETVLGQEDGLELENPLPLRPSLYGGQVHSHPQAWCGHVRAEARHRSEDYPRTGNSRIVGGPFTVHDSSQLFTTCFSMDIFSP